MSAALASVATSLETAAGSTTSANPNPPGHWSRIAAASEVLADATTSANATTSGYMLRAALALESIAGTDGNEENASYSGYLKRIVDALEVQAGAVEVGSLEHRMVLAAAGAEFGPPELPVIANGTFTGTDDWTDTSTGGTANLSLTGTALSFVGGTNPTGNYVTGTSIEGLTTGDVVTLQYEITATGGISGPMFSIGGGTEVGGLAGATTVGTHTIDVTVGASGAALKIRGAGSTAPHTWTMDNVEITAVIYA